MDRAQACKSTSVRIAERLGQSIELLAAFADVAEGRVVHAAVPVWCEARDWAPYLRGLTAAELERAEVDVTGFMQADARAPWSLRELARVAAAVTRLPRVASSTLPESSPTRLVKARKSLQIGALVATLRDLAEASNRIVDVGTGMGHFSRIASQSWLRDALGVDVNARLVGRAEALALGGRASYRKLDALAEPLPLEEGDLVVGLHACGEITDLALAEAVRVRARVAFVSCCLQKQRSARREALSATGRAHAFSLTRDVLGLSNLMARSDGVEVSQAASMQAREARHALRLLLERRGIPTDAGEEMRGVNRRRPRKGLETLAREAFAARGLTPPSAKEMDDEAQRARDEFALMRRCSLPRALLARVVECAVAFDRASLLEERGHSVTVAEAFGAEVSPRNVLVMGVPSD